MRQREGRFAQRGEREAASEKENSPVPQHSLPERGSERERKRMSEREREREREQTHMQKDDETSRGRRKQPHSSQRQPRDGAAPVGNRGWSRGESARERERERERTHTAIFALTHTGRTHVVVPNQRRTVVLAPSHSHTHTEAAGSECPCRG